MGRKHKKEFASAKIPHEIREANTTSTVRAKIVRDSQRVSQIDNLLTCRLNTREGSVQTQNDEFYQIYPAEETLLGLLFTKAIGFDIGAYLADNAMNLDGLNLKIQA